MLILARKEHERIVIGDDVVVEVIEIRGRNRALIGVEAPEGVRVRRAELPALPRRREVGGPECQRPEGQKVESHTP